VQRIYAADITQRAIPKCLALLKATSQGLTAHISERLDLSKDVEAYLLRVSLYLTLLRGIVKTVKIKSRYNYSSI
jgi:hypothetical protein